MLSRDHCTISVCSGFGSYALLHKVAAAALAVVLGSRGLCAAEPVACIEVKADRLVMHTAPGCYYELRIAPRFTRRSNGHYVLHLDLPSRNFLSPALAAPGTSTAASCPVGDRVLSLKPDEVWQSPAVPVGHKYQLTKRFGLVFSVYARAPEVGAKAPVTLGMSWQPEAPLPEKAAEQQAVVGREWQRFAVVVEHSQSEARGNARVSISSPTAIEIAGLQLEPWRDYPAFPSEPTAWMPGGAVRRDVAPATLPACYLPMDWANGAVSLRVRVPEAFGKRVTGERTILFVARFWGGILEINTKRSWIGSSKLNTQALQDILADGREHLLALAWDHAQARFYADGRPLSRAAVKRPPQLSTEDRMSYRIWIGTHNPRRRTIGGDIRDLRFHDRCLTEEEAARLPSAPAPAFSKSPCLTPPLRRVFRRDEEEVRLLLPVHGSISGETKVRLEGVPRGQASPVPRDGQAYLSLSFQPWLCSAGKRDCAIVLTQPGKPELRLPWPVHIVPAEARDRYTVGNWGGVGSTDALRWAKKLGLGLVDSREYSAEYLNQVGLLGLRASVNYHNIRRDPHPATDARLATMGLQAARLAKALDPFPWVTTCIHNSEGQGNDDVAESSAATASMRTELGLDRPLVQSRTGWADLSVRPKVDLRQFTKTGIVPDDYLPLRYVKWLKLKGDGMNMACAVAASAVQATALQVRMVQEPARAYYATWADTLCNWRYANSPAPMLTVWRQGLAAARSRGKAYFPLTGHTYYSPQVFLQQGGKKLRVPPSGDMAAAFLWTGLAMPAAEVRCFGFWAKDWEKQEQLRPGSHERIARAIREIQRLGPVVGDVPHCTAPLAVLLPETNKLGRAAEEWWHAVGQRMYRAGTIFDQNDLLVDYLNEDRVRRGELKHYRYLYIPALRYLPASIHREVQAWQREGQLILDTIANPAFAGNLRADFMLAKAPWIDEARCTAWAKAFRQRLNPYARLEAGRAIVIAKECPDTHFVFAVNNKWAETRLSAQLTGLAGGSDIADVERELKETGQQKALLSSRLFDTGVAQTVSISLREAPDAAIYDLRAGRRLTSHRSPDGRLHLRLELAPGSAAVLAVYRHAPAAPRLDALSRLQRGTAADLTVVLQRGRHGIDLTVTQPDGTPFDASGIYCIRDGSPDVPLRLPLDAPVGAWRIAARHLASGLATSATVHVE